MIYTFIALFMITGYYCAFLFYYYKILEVKALKFSFVLLTLICILGAYILLTIYDLNYWNIVVILFVMTMGLRGSIGMNWMQAFYGASICVLSAYCFRGMFTAISVFLFPGRDFLFDDVLYYKITLVAFPFAFLFFMILRKTILPDDKFKVFLMDKRQLRPVVIYEMAASANLATMNAGRYILSNNIWYMGVVLGASVLTLSMLIYAIYQSIQNAELVESQWTNKMLEEQYARQLRHYKSYQKYTESFQMFKHDYKTMMASVKALIRGGDGEKAILLIDNIYDDMQKRVKVHKKYSNDVVLDAMLQDLANFCEEKQIKFSFNVFAPKHTGLTLMDAIRVFANVTNNAIEACLEVPAEKRFFTVSSSKDKDWVTLEVANSYNGKVLMDDGKLLTTKKNGENHGFGMDIVKEIIERLGGFIFYEENKEEGVFLLRVHIPQVEKNKE